MKYAIIDIETTGGGRDGHRITEIAIIIHDGVNILDEYQTLVNPESPIPTWIVRLTGITNAMVADAPKFHEVAEKVFAMTYNCVFIAHSVNFDYGIIRNEFSRIGVKFSRQKLCSVRLARKWIPGHRSYSLGKLCQELDITINGRHRAYGDARATVSLMEIIIRRARKSGIDDLTKTPINSDSSIPQKLQGDLSKLSDAPGVVYFHDVTHAVIYVCSASQMLADTLLHIKKLSGSNPDLLKKTDHISSKLTGNELIARLIENNDLYHHSILKNRTSEIKRKFAIYAYEDQNGLMEIKVGKVVSSCKPLAIFQTEQHARMRLDTLALQYELCAKLVDGSNYSKCIYCLSQKCIRNQPLDQKIIRQYNQRAQRMIDTISWQGKSKVIIVEGRHEHESGIVVIEKGKYIGYGYIEDAKISRYTDLSDLSIQRQCHNVEVQSIIECYLDHHPGVRIVEIHKEPVR